MSSKFSFVEFKTMEDAANCLNLNNISFMGVTLKINRPSKYEGAPGVSFFAWDDMLARHLTGDLKVLTSGPPSRVLCLLNMVLLEDLQDSEEYAGVMEETRWVRVIASKSLSGFNIPHTEKKLYTSM